MRTERRSTAELARALKQLELENRSLREDPDLLAELDQLVKEAKSTESRGGLEHAAVVR
jgi:hypothetical protein